MAVSCPLECVREVRNLTELEAELAAAEAEGELVSTPARGTQLGRTEGAPGAPGVDDHLPPAAGGSPVLQSQTRLEPHRSTGIPPVYHPSIAPHVLL